MRLPVFHDDRAWPLARFILKIIPAKGRTPTQLVTLDAEEEKTPSRRKHRESRVLEARCNLFGTYAHEILSLSANEEGPGSSGFATLR